MDRETLVQELDRAREAERRARRTHNEARIVYFATHGKFRTRLEARCAAQDALQAYDEEHHEQG
jgi:CHAT domain-containing protein